MAQSAAGRKSLTEGAYWGLRADILACRLMPGEKIKINEVCLARGLSLGAVREALSRLTAEGLVIAEAQRGFQVTPVSQAELSDLTSTRIDIEIACAERAIALGDVEWESLLVAAYHRLSRTPERVADDPASITEAWAEAHGHFHAALVAACDSPWRLRLRQFLYDQSERYRRLSVPAVAEQRDLAGEHHALMAAALARDLPRFADLIRQHLDLTARRVISLTITQ